jgi:hypothetical protein
MFGGVIAEQVVDKILAKPDIPFALLICLLAIVGLFYLLLKSYKQNDKAVEQLEKQNTVMATIIQLLDTQHEASLTNRDIIQRVEICVSNASLQINNMFGELKSHRDECNRKIINNVSGGK